MRKRENRRRGKKIFKHTAKSTNIQNVRVAPRGGIRL